MAYKQKINPRTGQFNLVSDMPVSPGVDIDDAVAKRHTQNTDIFLATPVTNTLYVDGNRVDVYTANGSITKPFKKIQDAIDAVTGGTSANRFTIKISSGANYTEAINMNKDYVALVGDTTMVRLTGVMTIDNLYCSFTQIQLRGAVTLNRAANFNVNIDYCTLAGVGWTVTATAPVGNEYIQIHAGIVDAPMSFIGLAGVTFQDAWIQKNLTFTNATGCVTGILSGPITVNLETGAVVNMEEVQCEPVVTVNLKTGAVLNGNSDFVSTANIVNTGGTLNLTTKASGIKNIPAGTIVATNVQAALNELDTEKTTLAEVKAETDVASAISLKHSQNTDLYLGTAVTKVLYVDGNRVDSYTANGDITKPFKKIQDAIDAVTSPSATNKYLIEITPGAYYSDALTVNKVYITFRSCGVQGARISGAITVTNPGSPTPEQITFVGLRISGGLTCLASHIAINFVDCSVTGADIVITPTTPTDDEYLQVWSGLWFANVTLSGVYTYLMGGGFYSTFTATDKEFNINNADINEPFEAILSGTLIGSAFGNRAGNSKFTLNTGVNLHIDADTEGGSIITIAGGTLTRSTKGGNISNDSSVSGTTVKDALETLGAESHSQNTDTGLETLTTDVIIDKLTPEVRLTDSGTTEYARLTKVSLDNEMSLKNRIATMGGYEYSIGFVGIGYTTTPHNSLLNFGSGNATIEIWLKTADLSSYYFSFLIVKGSGGYYNDGFGIAVDTDTFYCYAHGANHNAAHNTDIFDSNWHMLNFVFDNVAGTITTYIDSVQKGVINIGVGSIDSINNLILGSGAELGGGLTGQLDGLRIYNRKLIQTEIQTNYNSGAGAHIVPVTNLILGYNFNEGTGVITEDASVNNLDATIVNGTWEVGHILAPGNIQEVDILSSKDGILAGGKGITKLGNDHSEVLINGERIGLQVNGTEKANIDENGILNTGDILPITDDTSYVGKNSITDPKAFKGLILKDTTNGNYYRIEVIAGLLTATQIV